MKVITLRDPWATLVAVGSKKIETRSWSTKYRGPLAIHASKTFTDDEHDTCYLPPFSDELLKAEYCACGRCNPLPRGAIVAVCDLLYIVKTEDVHTIPSDNLAEHELDFGNYRPGRYAWILHNVTRLEKPIPYTGHQGLRDAAIDVCAVAGIGFTSVFDSAAFKRMDWPMKRKRHIRIQLPSGGYARVSPDIEAKTLEALNEVAIAAQESHWSRSWLAYARFRRIDPAEVKQADGNSVQPYMTWMDDKRDEYFTMLGHRPATIPSSMYRDIAAWLDGQYRDYDAGKENNQT